MADSKLGTSRTSKSGYQDHLQHDGVAGHSSPKRTVKSNPGAGYHVTSPAATPSSNKDLKKRP